MFWQKKEETTRDELVRVAEQYFYKYLTELSAGTVKANLGPLSISVSFTVNEEKGNYVK